LIGVAREAIAEAQAEEIAIDPILMAEPVSPKL
jgi:hypothetical protein